jgi:hypothetical protein
MSSGPSNDPLVQQLQLLLTGYGYNFYNSTNIARSDDQLVRQRASYFLSEANALLATVRNDYQFRYIPPLTRANPDPPAEAMAKVRELEALQQNISRLESSIRGMVVPNQDRIWWRFHQEEPLLRQLLNYDLSLVRGCEQVHQVASQMTADGWHYQGGSQIAELLRQVTQTAKAREQFLLIQV